MIRYNNLIQVMNSTCKTLSISLKGEVEFSADLEKMYQNILKNQVPHNWISCSYLSDKTLGSWLKDLKQRLDFLKMWMIKG